MNKATIYDYVRMCKHFDNDCQECPLFYKQTKTDFRCEAFIRNRPDKVNEIILNWCKEHPVETRQDRFLKMFPNAKMNNHGVVMCCPTLINREFKCDIENVNCPECRKDYWLAEVNENE